MRTKYTKEIMEPIIRASYCWNDVCRHLNKTSNGGAVKGLFRRVCDYHKIDYSHFLGKRACIKRSIPITTILTNNSGFDRSTVRAYIKRYELLPHKCAICTLEPRWTNSPLTMVLDHIDGNPKNHELDNLRFVCPNCNSQLETTAGKRNKGKVYKMRAKYVRHKRLSIPYHD